MHFLIAWSNFKLNCRLRNAHYFELWLKIPAIYCSLRHLLPDTHPWGWCRDDKIMYTSCDEVTDVGKKDTILLQMNIQCFRASKLFLQLSSGYDGWSDISYQFQNSLLCSKMWIKWIASKLQASAGFLKLNVRQKELAAVFKTWEEKLNMYDTYFNKNGELKSAPDTHTMNWKLLQFLERNKPQVFSISVKFCDPMMSSFPRNHCWCEGLKISANNWLKALPSSCPGLFPDTEEVGEGAEGARPRRHRCSYSGEQEWFRRHQVSSPPFSDVWPLQSSVCTCWSESTSLVSEL